MSGGLAGDVARARAAWAEVPRDVVVRRSALVAAMAVGLTVTMVRSYLFGLAPGWSLGWIPDARPVALLVVASLLGAYAATGPAERRVHLLWFTVGVGLVFHLEAATVHWFTDKVTGSVTGTRVDLVALAGTATAVAGVLALHGDAAASDLARDLRSRGVPGADADAARLGLARAAVRRAFAIGGGVLALGVVVRVAEGGLGEASVGGTLPALVAGIVVLAIAAVVAVRRPRNEGVVEPVDS